MSDLPTASRRDFMKTSAAVAAASSFVLPGIQSKAYAQTTDVMRVGVIGCGGRGSGAATNAVEGSEGVVITALADMFPDRLQGARNYLSDSLGDAYQVTDDTAFTGFDAYERLLALDNVDLVILATPPHFRPMHFDAAVNAGKHVFMEKPVAVDPTGIRTVIEAGRRAQQKGLGVVAGTQRRHQQCYLDAMDAIHDGAIGDITSANVYWQQGALWFKSLEEAEQKGWSQMEWQLRNWLYFTWLSGDHICEQHIHNIDIANWAMGDTPVRAYGNGGRQQRVAKDFGNIFDHFAVEYEYSGGRKVTSMCRQIPGCSNRVYETVAGTNGFAILTDVNAGCRLLSPEGQLLHHFTGGADRYVQEHTNLVASIRSGEPLNEAERVAHSTLAAIIGRESCYSGKEIDFKWALEESQLDLSPEAYEFGDIAIPEPAMPGEYEMI